MLSKLTSLKTFVESTHLFYSVIYKGYKMLQLFIIKFQIKHSDKFNGEQILSSLI